LKRVLRRKPSCCGGFIELAGLEPATSWVRPLALSNTNCRFAAPFG
jgi:hypothetical protein